MLDLDEGDLLHLDAPSCAIDEQNLLVPAKFLMKPIVLLGEM